MSDFCTKCNKFIEDAYTHTWIHVEKEHMDEATNKEATNKFIEDYIIDEMSGLDVMAKEWVKLSQIALKIQHNHYTDPKINILNDQINKLQVAINTAKTALTDLEAPHFDELSPIQARKIEIEDLFRAQHSETVKSLDLTPALVEFRETKSLKVISPEKAVDILVANGKVAEGISGFKIPFMRKLKDVDLLGDDVAAYTSKINVYVKPKEDITLEPEE